MSNILNDLKIDTMKVIDNLCATGCDEAWSIVKLNNMITDIDDALKSNGWISVSYGLPNDSDHIIMLDEKGGRFSGRGSVLKRNLEQAEPTHGRTTRYTHWQMIPEAPLC